MQNYSKIRAYNYVSRERPILQYISLLELVYGSVKSTVDADTYLLVVFLEKSSTQILCVQIVSLFLSSEDEFPTCI